MNYQPTDRDRFENQGCYLRYSADITQTSEYETYYCCYFCGDQYSDRSEFADHVCYTDTRPFTAEETTQLESAGWRVLRRHASRNGLSIRPRVAGDYLARGYSGDPVRRYTIEELIR